MDALAIILGVVVLLAMFIVMVVPSLLGLSVFGMMVHKINPVKNRGFRLTLTLSAFIFLPLLMNLSIDRYVNQLVNASHGSLPLQTDAKIIGVSKTNRHASKVPLCNDDCLGLLISGTVERYLVIDEGDISPELGATAFWIEEQQDCPPLGGLIRESDKLAFTMQSMALSSRCLMSGPDSASHADVIVQHRTIKDTDGFLRSSYRDETLVFEKTDNAVDFDEVYRDVRVEFRKIAPILLPSFDYQNRKYTPDFMRVGRFKTRDKTLKCGVTLLMFDDCGWSNNFKSASRVLGATVDKISLEKSAQIDNQKTRSARALELVNDIISENRAPKDNEWQLIKTSIRYDYPKPENYSVYSETLVNILNYPKFLVPDASYVVKKLDLAQSKSVADAIIPRLTTLSTYSMVGKDSEKAQRNNIYGIINALPKEALSPHFDQLVEAISKNGRGNHYLKFFEKFGDESVAPMLVIIENDKRMLRPLSRVMCRIGGDLSGAEEDLFTWLVQSDLQSEGGFSRIIFALLKAGISKESILESFNPADPTHSKLMRGIEKQIQRFESGKTYCG